MEATTTNFLAKDFKKAWNLKSVFKGLFHFC